MSIEAPESSPREETDESLRIERQQADDALAESESGAREQADEVVRRARSRADEVLAMARARADSRRLHAVSSLFEEAGLASLRAVADGVVRRERSAADLLLSDERAARLNQSSAERSDTDEDLLLERTHADEALATRDDFLLMVSHDLQNLVHAVRGFADLTVEALVEPDHTETVRTYCNYIDSASKRMEGLVSDLVDIASIQAGMLVVRPEASDVSKLVAEAIQNATVQASVRGINLRAEVAPIPLTQLDSFRILQVLANLIGNAIKFTPRGGNIVVHAQQVADSLEFSVADTGAGIPADQLENVFVRFVQVVKKDRRSLGLGLYISRCIVESHGGRIWVESKIGEGSCFRFSLPFKPAA